MRILLIGDLNSTFIKRDYDTLSSHYEVVQFTPPNDYNEWPKYISKIKRIIKNIDVAFGWFAGWHTLPMVLYAKKYNKGSLIVVGGYDAVSFPQIGYGAFSNLKESIPAKYVLENADLILPVSHFLVREIRKYTNANRDNIFPLSLGCNTNFWRPNGRRDNIILTVAGAKNIKRVKVKGLDVFVKSAKYVPNTQFIVIGVEDEAKRYLEKIAPKNVELIGYVPNKELLPYYQKAKVYAQLSITESFGYALCEAMLSGDIPVCSKRGSMPEVVGDTGFYVPYGDPKAAAQAIRRALKAPEKLGLRARERIMQLFPLKKREEALVKLISIVAMMKYSTIMTKWARKPAKNLKVDIQQKPSDSIEITIDVHRRPIINLLGK